jgi:hypothetical protein
LRWKAIAWGDTIGENVTKYKNGDYPTSLAASTLIILFSEMLKISKFFIKNCEEKVLNLQEYYFVWNDFCKLIKYSTNMLWSCQRYGGTLGIKR